MSSINDLLDVQREQQQFFFYYKAFGAKQLSKALKLSGSLLSHMSRGRATPTMLYTTNQIILTLFVKDRLYLQNQFSKGCSDE